jgi:hypothetical protein
MAKQTKQIKGFEGLYSIDENGNILSIDRFIVDKNNRKVRINGLKKKKTLNADGYEVVSLFKNNKQNLFYVHRLIAENFIENPNNLPCINHINGIKNDNKISNLEWCSYSENNFHAYKELSKVGFWKDKFNSHPKNKNIIQFDLNGNKIKEYQSISECARQIGLRRETIRDNIKGKIKIILGQYTFKTKI